MTHKFDFFHGTSDIFLDSIRKYGLGKINPNIDYKNLDVLIYLNNLAKKYLQHNEEYKKHKDTSNAIANQTELKIIDSLGKEYLHNYRHDCIYVAISRARAAIYASSNKYGSEILERIIFLFNLLKRENIEFQIPDSINLFNFEKYLSYEPKPIIVKINRFEDEKLEREDGLPAKESLNFLRYMIPKMSQKEKFEFLQFCNFRLLEPVDTKRLTFYELDYDGSIENNNFEFTLSEI